MKFSYALIKKLAPGIPAARAFAEAISMHLFEIEEARGDLMDIKVLPNRFSDAASHLGIAREASAICGVPIAFSPAPLPAPREAKSALRLEIAEGAGCSRYAALRFALSRYGKTPAFMRRVLTTCGLRPISPVVDVLNFVMLEVGQPLHAFDASRLREGILVRRARPGERLTAIDGKSYELAREDIVIADALDALAIAGIKGGKSSEVRAETREIIVEAATFDPASIYRTSRRIGLQTDASQRFGHGLSPELPLLALARVAELLHEVCGAELISRHDVYPVKQARRILSFDIAYSNRVSGLNLSFAEAREILVRLGFVPLSGTKFEVPPLRLDVTIPEDLTEEVVRIYGLDRIPRREPVVSLRAPAHTPSVLAKERVRHELVRHGFSEAYGYSFAGSGEGFIELANPASVGKEFLRSSLLPGLRAFMRRDRERASLRVFELGHVWGEDRRERLSLGVAVRDSAEGALRTLRGVFDALLAHLGIGDLSVAHRASSLQFSAKGSVLATLETDTRHHEAFLEADLMALWKLRLEARRYREIPLYPSVTRDLSFSVPQGERLADLLVTLASLAVPTLEDTELLDYYEGEELIAKGEVSATFRLTFRASDRTLTDHEVDGEVAKIQSALTDRHQLRIR